MQRLYPGQPVVGVGALIVRNDELLLVRRGKEPACGLWSIPGGAVELGETLHAALKREIREECGLSIRVGPPVAILDSLTADRSGKLAYHYVLVDFWAEVVDGELHPASDASEARWVSRREIRQLKLTTGLLRLLDHLGFLSTSSQLEPPREVVYWTQEGIL